MIKMRRFVRAHNVSLKRYILQCCHTENKYLSLPSSRVKFRIVALGTTSKAFRMLILIL